MLSLLHKDFVADRALSRAAGVFVFIILTALSGFVRIPLWFTPVPVTLQTFFVLLAGAFLGRRLGSFSQLGYLCLGAAGLPVFSSAGSGCAYLLGPTGGYMIGFVAAAFSLGCWLPRLRSRAGIAAAFVLSDMIILAAGTIWLALTTGCGLPRAFFIGWLPFLAGDTLKACAAAAVYLRLRDRIKEYF